jgi:hypothetical protein
MYSAHLLPPRLQERGQGQSMLALESVVEEVRRLNEAKKKYEREKRNTSSN